MVDDIQLDVLSEDTSFYLDWADSSDTEASIASYSVLVYPQSGCTGTPSTSGGSCTHRRGSTCDGTWECSPGEKGNCLHQTKGPKTGERCKRAFT